MSKSKICQATAVVDLGSALNSMIRVWALARVDRLAREWGACVALVRGHGSGPDGRLSQQFDPVGEVYLELDRLGIARRGIPAHEGSIARHK